MAQSQTASINLVAAVATAVCVSQAPGAAGALVINGTLAAAGAATFGAARRVLVTTSANETGKTLVINGLDRNRNPMTETVALPNATTVSTLQDFLVVNSATISAAASSLTVGNSGVGSTRWIVLDTNRKVFNCGLAVNLGGVTSNVTVEYTFDPVDKAFVDSAFSVAAGDSSAAGLTASTYQIPVPFSLAGLTAISADAATAFIQPVRAIRLTVNSGALTPGTRLTVMQQGV